MPRSDNDFPAVAVDPDRPWDSFRDLYLCQEPALMASIHRGDRREATRLINLVLVHIYSAGEERNELLKGLLLELVVMMSRAAVEAGASQAEVLGLRFQNLTKLASISDDEALARWLRESVIRVFEAVERRTTRAVPRAVRKALDMIRRDAGSPLTREQVARHAGVSPRHLAHLLKERTGLSFTALVRGARVDRACDLLLQTDLTIAAIAGECGFCDQSYFTHVFQQVRKTTPGQYRENARRVAPGASA